ncbi:hypothetical protein BaRGS_00012140 [Batillaria attramentaria]|uniref:Uncharacterized protein n=1 Tax=Batillaria attramentaria TaxID=370345 RepID=A0ABD0LBA8_9CAEN
MSAQMGTARQAGSRHTPDITIIPPNPTPAPIGQDEQKTIQKKIKAFLLLAGTRRAALEVEWKDTINTVAEERSAAR